MYVLSQIISVDETAVFPTYLQVYHKFQRGKQVAVKCTGCEKYTLLSCNADGNNLPPYTILNSAKKSFCKDIIVWTSEMHGQR
jgi:hypothetical protein